MKKSYLLVSAIMSLCLCACQGKTPSGSSEPKMEPEKTPTMEVNFQELENNVGVTEEVKAYIDAMHEQEKNLTYPDRISYLFGPTDLKKMSDKAESDDNHKDYPADETGGVDVCQMLNNKQKYQNVPIELKWEKGEKEFSEDAVIRYWTEFDKSDAHYAKLEEGGASAKLPNLKRATTYYYQLVDGEDVSQMGSFETADYTRVMTMGAVNNVRDLGGYMTSYGVRTRQGLIFRGYEINEKGWSGGHNASYTPETQEVAERDMNLGLELDLRAKSGTYQGNQEKSAVEGVEYKRCAINSYAGFITDPNKTSESENADRNLPQEIFEALANAEEKHVYFHCWGGADRTGTIAFLLNAICGVSYTDLIIDFEITSQTNNKRCHMHNSSSAYFPKFLYAFTQIEGFDFEKTVNENAVTLLKKVGVTDETIEAVRKVMIPGYETGMQPVETVNENGTDELPTSSAQLLEMFAKYGELEEPIVA
ncbi:MAG: tyrosine-protein phosphatase [Bacilli bacterium]|nr:tyrosine-protein phosphatase [Bacilli bacterium]